MRDAAAPGTVYWEAKALSAEGRIEEALYGNAVGTTRSYDPETGLVTSIQSGTGESAEVQDLGYAFDSFGNLTTREDFLQDLYESFTYDTLNRLIGATVYDATTDTQLASKSYSYDAIGNIVNKSDVGAADYVYGTGNAAGAGDAGPHAVVSAGGATYAYDDNGNLTSGAGRALTWTSFNKPQTVATTSTTSTFVYGPERARIQQQKVQGATTTTIKYVGAVFEQVTRTGEATQSVHYLFAGGRRIAVYTEDDAATTPSETLRYVHTDHLGSVDTLTDESGAVVERLSYDAWGKRRIASGANAWRDAVVPIAGAETRRGFTGHEHLDEFELIHMNGRVYDPSLGRFLSADPFIQFPASTQGLNRYSYVFNNPLSFTDPSGYFIKWLARTVKKLLKNPLVRTVVAVAFAVYGAPHLASAMLGTSTGVAFAVAKGAIGGFGAGLIASGGDLKAAFIGGLTGAAFGYIGGSSTFGGEFSGQRLLAHGVVGGMSSRLQGGKFATGFFSAGVAKLMTPAIETVADGNLMLGAVASAVVGGTATAVGGGKFANGATTGAFGYLFNQHANDEAMRVRKEPVWPTDYREITSPYSLNRVDPTTGKQSLPHTAIDIRNPHGGRVYSILDGVVVSVDYSDNPIDA